MPIHVLKYKKKEGKYDFNMIKDWLDEFVRGKVYVAILTDDNEVIIEPRKSTRPLDFGYARFDSSAGARELADVLNSEYKLKVIEVETYAWNIERPPWVKVPIE